MTFSNPSSTSVLIVLSSDLLLKLSVPSDKLVVKLRVREPREVDWTALEMKEEEDEGCCTVDPSPT